MIAAVIDIAEFRRRRAVKAWGEDYGDRVGREAADRLRRSREHTPPGGRVA